MGGETKDDNIRRSVLESGKTNGLIYQRWPRFLKETGPSNVFYELLILPNYSMGQHRTVFFIQFCITEVLPDPTLKCPRKIDIPVRYRLRRPERPSGCRQLRRC